MLEKLTEKYGLLYGRVKNMHLTDVKDPFCADQSEFFRGSLDFYHTLDYKESPVSSKNMETSLWSINWLKLWAYKEFRTVARVVDFVLFTTVTSSSQ